MSLAEIVGTGTLFDEAGTLFARINILELTHYIVHFAVRRTGKRADRSTLALAWCSFYMNRWEQASDLFFQWLGNNMETPGSDRARADFKQCRTIIDQNRRSIGQTAPQRPGPMVRFLNWAGREISKTFVALGKKM